MSTFYLVCAFVGSAGVVVQFVMLLLGGDHGLAGMDLDADGHMGDGGGHVGDHGGMHADGHGEHHGHAHDSSWFFSVISFRTMTAAAAFFGWTGLAVSNPEVPETIRLLTATAAGGCAMLVVAWLMSMLSRLQAEGTVDIRNTVGCPASVYLTIPAGHTGTGKVTVKVQGRTMEYGAITETGDSLPTGSPVMVVGLAGADLLEVAPLNTGEGGA